MNKIRYAISVNTHDLLKFQVIGISSEGTFAFQIDYRDLDGSSHIVHLDRDTHLDKVLNSEKDTNETIESWKTISGQDLSIFDHMKIMSSNLKNGIRYTSHIQLKNLPDFEERIKTALHLSIKNDAIENNKGMQIAADNIINLALTPNISKQKNGVRFLPIGDENQNYIILTEMYGKAWPVIVTIENHENIKNLILMQIRDFPRAELGKVEIQKESEKNCLALGLCLPRNIVNTLNKEHTH